jgi:hypothetical protein
MKKLIKEFCLKMPICVLFGVLICFTTTSLTLGLTVGILLFFVLLAKSCLKICYHFLVRSKRFQAYFDFLTFKAPIPNHLEIVNLGSSSAKYAFNYTELINGTNFALAPQTLRYDFSILKNYHSYIKSGGIILIPLCPFTGCVGEESPNPQDDIKYYAILHPAVIHDYSAKTAKKITTDTKNLLFIASKQLGLKSFLRTFLAALIRQHRYYLGKPLNKPALERDAELRINSWMKQFSLDDLNSKYISDKNQLAINYNIRLLSDIVQFCLQRDFRPVIIIPPVTQALHSRLPVIFRELYIYSLLTSDTLRNVRFLNYLDDVRFSDDALFFNSFFLNEKGSKLFTAQVISDILSV